MRRKLHVVVLAIGLGTSAAQAGVPVTFQAGNQVRSSEVNGNFAYLDSIVKAQASLISGLSGSVDALREKIKVDSAARVRKAQEDSAKLASSFGQNIPVGSVIAVMTGPGADGYLPGSGSTWLLAAGQEAVNGLKIPDLRGVFLRGIDYIVTGRGLTKRDLDTSRSAGHYQDDALQDHLHTNGVTDDLSTAFFRGWSTTTLATHAIQNEGAPVPAYEGKTSPVFPGSARVATETRSKNVAVYWYIKVK